MRYVCLVSNMKKKKDSDALVPVVVDDDGRAIARPMGAALNPVNAYLARLSTGSRRTQAGAIKTVVQILGGDDVFAFAWDEVRYEHARALQAWLKEEYAPATANRVLSAFRGVMEEGFNLGVVSSDTFMRIKHVKDVKYQRMPKGRMLEVDEFHAILGACGDAPIDRRDAALIGLLAYGGLRRAESVGARLDKYEARTGRLQIIGKGNKERVVFLAPSARALIKAWLPHRPAGGNTILTHIEEARPLTPEATFSILRRRAKAAGVDPTSFSSHDFRRSALSLGFSAAKDARTVQRFAGHASLNTTAGYDRRNEAVLDELANALEDAWKKKEEP